MHVVCYYHRMRDAIILEMRGEDTGIPDMVMNLAEANGFQSELRTAIWQANEARKSAYEISAPRGRNRDVSTG